LRESVREREREKERDLFIYVDREIDRVRVGEHFFAFPFLFFPTVAYHLKIVCRGVKTCHENGEKRESRNVCWGEKKL